MLSKYILKNTPAISTDKNIFKKLFNKLKKTLYVCKQNNIKVFANNKTSTYFFIMYFINTFNIKIKRLTNLNKQILKQNTIKRKINKKKVKIKGYKWKKIIHILKKKKKQSNKNYNCTSVIQLKKKKLSQNVKYRYVKKTNNKFLQKTWYKFNKKNTNYTHKQTIKNSNKPKTVTLIILLFYINKKPIKKIQSKKLRNFLLQKYKIKNKNKNLLKKHAHTNKFSTQIFFRKIKLKKKLNLKSYFYSFKKNVNLSNKVFKKCKQYKQIIKKYIYKNMFLFKYNFIKTTINGLNYSFNINPKTPLYFQYSQTNYKKTNDNIFNKITKNTSENNFCFLSTLQNKNTTNKNNYSNKNNALLYKSFIYTYIINFLEKYTGRKIWLKTDYSDKITNFWQKYINIYMTKNNNVYKKYDKVCSCQDLLKLIVTVFLTKDLSIFLLFLKKVLEKNHFKNHKKILMLLFDLIKKNNFLIKHAKISGFSFDIRGKVGVSGNAKKRHLFFSIGKITTTTQTIRSSMDQINIWTPTGQMGITCTLQY